MHKVCILTISDRSSQGTRSDASGPILHAYMTERGYTVPEVRVVPDDVRAIQEAILVMVQSHDPDVLLTTGGTGIGPRDVTPEATKGILDRELPGMAEAMRMETLKQTRFAMISRQVVGTLGQTLIVNLPGSPKACTECLDVVFPVFAHVTRMIRNDTGHEGEA